MPSVRFMIHRAERFPSIVKLQMEGVQGEVRYVRERTCGAEKAMSGAYEQWSCSECGCSLPIGSYDLTAADAGGAPKVVKRGKFTVNYCPNCGAKVVNDD